MRIGHVVLLAMLTLGITAVNASVTAPNGIIAYVPITLTNYQSTALAANTPIAIGATNAFSSTVIGLNALAYQQYETCNLNNAEFFYANATVIPSWLEGNMLNENTANPLCSSASSTNSLSSSANVLYWVKIGGNAAAFLPANTGTATTNTIYLGWAGNYMTSGNTLLSIPANVGEAPQLSCSNPYSTSTCNGIYGQYDNGNSVFSFYDDFIGNTLNSNYWTNGGGGATLTVSNSLTVSGTSEGLWLYGKVSLPIQIADTEITSTTSGIMQLRLGYSFLGGQTVYDSVTNLGYSTSGSQFQIESALHTCCGVSTSLPSGLTTPYIQSFGWIGTGQEFAYVNYANKFSNPDSTYSYSTPGYLGLLVTYATSGSYATTLQWVRSRTNPPANIMPGSTFGSVVVKSSPTISLANAIAPNSIDVISGSASDNALVTATCFSGDSCHIDNANGASVASGTTTATLAYNSLPLGYSVLYANDVTTGIISGTVLVRRINTVNSVQINFVNTQSSAIPAGAQLDIAFSAHNYTILESNTLNNTVLYFQNGTVAYSWLEGGVTDNLEYAANILSLSANVFYWFKVPSASFLPANTAIAPTNTIYMGFDIPANNLMDGNFIGEAPQLSPSYAEYDNGAKIFNYYLVNPISTSGFTVSGSFIVNTSAPAGSYFDTPNAFSAPIADDHDYIYSSNPAFSPGNIITYWFRLPNDALGDLFFMASSSGEGQFSRIDERGSGNTDTGFLYTTNWYSWGGSGNLLPPALGDWDKVDIVIPSSSSMIMYDTPTSNTPLGTLGSVNTGSFTPDVDGDYFGLNSDTAGSGTDFWDAIIVRDYLPGGSFPATSSYPASEYTLPTLPNPYPSSRIIGPPGANAMINDSGAGAGIAPYSYQWYVAYGNVPTFTSANALEANTLLGTGTSSGQAQSQNALFSTNSLTSTGTYYFVLNATDSYPTSVNTIAVSVTLQATIPTTTTTTITQCTYGCVQGSGGTGASGTVPSTSIQTTTSANTSSTTQHTTSITTTIFTSATTSTTPQPQVEVTVTPVGDTTSQLCNGEDEGYSVAYTSLGSTFKVSPGVSQCFNTTAINITKAANITNSTLAKILVVNFSISDPSALVNATIGYPCSIAPAYVAPFILRNDTWVPITPFTVNATACTVSFIIPSDPIIGVFHTQYANSQTTYPTTLTTSIPPAVQQSALVPWLEVVALFAIIAFLLFMVIRQRRRKSRRMKDQSKG